MMVRRALSLLLLIVAGEAIFALPFHVARFFRPSLLLALDISNTELGIMQSAYGLVALLSYFPGGILADRFSARYLISASLFATALGGFYFATLPSFWGMLLLHLYWGATTILLFWGALIVATRHWGSGTSQGRAFGLLDGGRGLIAALLATAGVVLLSTGSQGALSGSERSERLTLIILSYTAVTLALAGACFFLLPKAHPSSKSPGSTLRVLTAFSLLAQPRILFHALVILAAYCGYKGIDFYSVYGVDVFGLNELEGARLATLSIWLRPIFALLAGLLADRFGGARLTTISFAGLLGLYLFSALGPSGPSSLWALGVTAVGTSALVFSFRSLYFALLGESKIPLHHTGAAVGVISFIGFTPDFFFPALSGWIVDAHPGALGYQLLFLSFAAWAAMGLLASEAMRRSPLLEDKVK